MHGAVWLWPWVIVTGFSTRAVSTARLWTNAMTGLKACPLQYNVISIENYQDCDLVTLKHCPCRGQINLFFLIIKFMSNTLINSLNLMTILSLEQMIICAPQTGNRFDFPTTPIFLSTFTLNVIFVQIRILISLHYSFKRETISPWNDVIVNACYLYITSVLVPLSGGVESAWDTRCELVLWSSPGISTVKGLWVVATHWVAGLIFWMSKLEMILDP